MRRATAGQKALIELGAGAGFELLDDDDADMDLVERDRDRLGGTYDLTTHVVGT